MGTTKLAVYNGALRICEERRLATLSDGNHACRLLDDVWGDGETTGAVKHCLQMGQWTFATRTAAVAYDSGIDPDFGYPYAFEQPDDLVRVMAVCQDEYFKVPLNEYVDERGYWYASLQTIYVKWVSNDSEYGADLSLWPESFSDLVHHYLANKIVGSLTGATAETKKLVRALWKEAKKDAMALDGMNNPTRFTPEGDWSRARRGYGVGTKDRNGGQFYG
jgi:hypothetical protein